MSDLTSLRLRAQALLFAVLLASCSGGRDVGTDSTRYALEEVARYGWGSLEGASDPLTEREREASAGVLGHPTGVAAAPDGKVYVLDADFQKIVVFDADGRYERVILGGSGRGPGEFIRPRSLTLSPDDRLWVNDQMEQRITEFDLSGQMVRVLESPFAFLDLAATGQRLYATRLAVDSTARVVVLDTLGKVSATLVHPGVDDMDPGVPSAGGIGEAPGGRVVFAHQRAGRWQEIEGTLVGPVQGVALHPDVRTTMSKLPSGAFRISAPIDVWSAGGLPGGLIFVYYAASLEGDSARTFRLALFDSTGTHIQTIPVPAGAGTFGHSVTEPEVFIQQNDPFPQIVRLRLIPANQRPD